MTKKRLFLICGASVLVAVAIGVYLLLANLDQLVERGIEKYGSQAAGTSVRVEKVAIDLSGGRGSILGLTVANPSGFSREPIFALGEISLALEVASVTKPVPVIEAIRIAAPAFLYEVNGTGTSNLTILKQNLQRSAKANTRPAASGSGKEQRFRIRELTIAQGQGEIDLSAIGGKRHRAKLDRITLRNLGGKSGITSDQLATAILDALIRELERVAVRQGTKELLRGAAGDALRKLQGQ